MTGKLFGDSLVRGLQPFSEKLGVVGVQVNYLPDRWNRKIRREVERAPVLNTNLVIIAASGNNLHRKGETGKRLSHLSVRSWLRSTIPL